MLCLICFSWAASKEQTLKPVTWGQGPRHRHAPWSFSILLASFHGRKGISVDLRLHCSPHFHTVLQHNSEIKCANIVSCFSLFVTLLPESNFPMSERSATSSYCHLFSHLSKVANTGFKKIFCFPRGTIFLYFPLYKMALFTLNTHPHSKCIIVYLNLRIPTSFTEAPFMPFLLCSS